MCEFITIMKKKKKSNKFLMATTLFLLENILSIKKKSKKISTINKKKRWCFISIYFCLVQFENGFSGDGKIHNKWGKK